MRQEAVARFGLGLMFGHADQHHEAAREFDQAAGLYDRCGEPLQAARARAAAGFELDLAKDFAGSESQLARAASGFDAKAAIVSRHPIPDPAGPLFSDLVVSALTHHAPAGRGRPLNIRPAERPVSPCSTVSPAPAANWAPNSAIRRSSRRAAGGSGSRAARGAPFGPCLRPRCQRSRRTAQRRHAN